ncbi:MAG: DUF3098 domain-containing protein [bacterium]
MNNLAFSKINYLIIGVSVLIIILGFVLMHGSTTVDEFNPDVFSFRRITLAPITCMVGFVGVIFGIMWKSKSKA